MAVIEDTTHYPPINPCREQLKEEPKNNHVFYVRPLMIMYFWIFANWCRHSWIDWMAALLLVAISTTSGHALRGTNSFQF